MNYKRIAAERAELARERIAAETELRRTEDVCVAIGIAFGIILIALCAVIYPNS